jgi:hypothetical protein
MNAKELDYNIFRENTFFLRDKYKKKGKDYGIINLNKKQINSLAEAIDLMSVAPISPKFSEKIELFILPRFNEINEFLYSEKTLSDILGIEISKENHKDIIKALTFHNVITGLEDRGYSIDQLSAALKDIKFLKIK